MKKFNATPTTAKQAAYIRRLAAAFGVAGPTIPSRAVDASRLIDRLEMEQVHDSLRAAGYEPTTPLPEL